MRNSVLIAMSGGVDSSVAAYLLKEAGYKVTGITMRLCGESDGTSLAASVADKLGVDFMTVDYRDEFQEFVVKPFIESYEQGRTPNPCIECNKCIKFGRLIDDSDEGFEANMDEAPMLATGHYAVIDFGKGLVNGQQNFSETDSAEERFMLRKSGNLAKDQSYFLYSLDQETLSRTLFPLGSMDKDEVRKIAEEQGFTNAKNKDSQDICFIPDGDYAKFIRDYTSTDYPAGNFVDMEGNVLGRHQGIIKYTLGQRKGLGLALKKPMYVYRLDMQKNEVILADNDQLFSKELIAENFNWVSMPEPSEDFRALGRIRYRHKEAPCTVSTCKDGTVRIVFDEPQRAITSGQSVVLYDIESDQYVLGGGIIK